MKTPASKEECLRILDESSMVELLDMGLSHWSTTHEAYEQYKGMPFINEAMAEPPVENNCILLIPAAWYKLLPEGYEFTTIFGGKERFIAGRSSDDHRYGYLAYGVLRPAQKS